MILTVTPNPAVDQTVVLDEPFSEESVNRCSDSQLDAGGKGVNVSKYLSELDAQTVASGFGGGLLGEYLTKELDAAGVAHDFVTTDEQTRLNTTILDPDSEYKLNQSGPSIAPRDIDKLVETVRSHDPDIVLVGGSLPPGFDPSDVDRLATAGDWWTAVDTGGDLLTRLDANYALCKPNRHELAEATGRPTNTLEQCVTAAKALQRQGFERVVASLGSDGAVMVTENAVYRAPALDVEATDTVGAGDALVAGVLAGVNEGLSEHEALARGIATAAQVVRVAGTRPPSFTNLHSDRVEITSI